MVSGQKGGFGVVLRGQKLLSMDRAVHPKGARAALRALLTGPLLPSLCTRPSMHCVFQKEMSHGCFNLLMPHVARFASRPRVQFAALRNVNHPESR